MIVCHFTGIFPLRVSILSPRDCSIGTFIKMTTALDTLRTVFTDALGPSTPIPPKSARNSGSATKTPSPRTVSTSPASRELMNVHELWVRTKRKLSKREDDIKRLQDELNALKSDRSDGHDSGLIADIEELRDKQKFYELQLESSREEVARARDANERLRSRVNKLQDRLRTKNSTSTSAEERTRTLERKLMDVTSSTGSRLDWAMMDLRERNAELNESRASEDKLRHEVRCALTQHR